MILFWKLFFIALLGDAILFLGLWVILRQFGILKRQEPQRYVLCVLDIYSTDPGLYWEQTYFALSYAGASPKYLPVAGRAAVADLYGDGFTEAETLVQSGALGPPREHLLGGKPQRASHRSQVGFPYFWSHSHQLGGARAL